MQDALKVVKKNAMLLALVVLTLFFQWLTKGTLLVPQNVTNLISQNGYVVILAVGMLICILTGGNIDLSIGSIVALIGALAGVLIVNNGVNIYLAMAICLLAGIAIGVWQGFWIAYVRIPAFIVTLSGMMLWRGVALIVLNGLTISPFPESMTRYFISSVPELFGTVELGGIFKGSYLVTSALIGLLASAVYVFLQISDRLKKIKKGYEVEKLVWTICRCALICVSIMALTLSLSQYKGIQGVLILLAIVVLVYSYFTSKTVYGRHIYAIGGNEKAAKLSGINTNKMLFFAYVNMAFLSALAALICVARFNSAAPAAGTNYELDAIGACYIGGASAYGGTGTVGGAVIGAIFMGVLNNGMSIAGIDNNVQKVIKALVLLAAVAFDVLSKRRSKTS